MILAATLTQVIKTFNLFFPPWVVVFIHVMVSNSPESRQSFALLVYLFAFLLWTLCAVKMMFPGSFCDQGLVHILANDSTARGMPGPGLTHSASVYDTCFTATSFQHGNDILIDLKPQAHSQCW